MKRNAFKWHREARELHDAAHAGDPVARALVDAPPDDEPDDELLAAAGAGLFVRDVEGDPPEECG